MKLDVHLGYNNVHIKEGDKWKASFRDKPGSLGTLGYVLGLMNSPATFQTMMNDTLKELN